MTLFSENTKEPSSGKASNAWVTEGSLATFAQDVLQQSRNVPVLVDFWAPWCGPCKQLGPLLEKMVLEAKGALRLVKIDVDKNQQLALQMRVQSIPAVFAFMNGQPVDGFMGALPEKELKAFVGRLLNAGLQPTVEPLLNAADEAYLHKNYGEAALLYGEILSLQPDHLEALCGLTRCYTALGQLEQAQGILSQIPSKHHTSAAYQGAKAALDLAMAPQQEPSDIRDLKARLTKTPNDHQAALDVAMALNQLGQREEAMTFLLSSIRQDRTWNEMAARKQLLVFFEAWGAKDPLTVSGRKALSSILFS